MANGEGTLAHLRLRGGWENDRNSTSTIFHPIPRRLWILATKSSLLLTHCTSLLPQEQFKVPPILQNSLTRDKGRTPFRSASCSVHTTSLHSPLASYISRGPWSKSVIGLSGWTCCGLACQTTIGYRIASYLHIRRMDSCLLARLTPPVHSTRSHVLKCRSLQMGKWSFSVGRRGGTNTSDNVVSYRPGLLLKSVIVAGLAAFRVAQAE